MYSYNNRRPVDGITLNDAASEMVNGRDLGFYLPGHEDFEMEPRAAAIGAELYKQNLPETGAPYLGPNAQYWGMGPARDNPAAAPAAAGFGLVDGEKVQAQSLIDALPPSPAYTGPGGNYLGTRSAAQRAAANVDPEYQQDGMKFLANYLNVPFTKDWNRQIWEAPLGGWVRRGAEHIGFDPNVAAGAERIVAGLAATGIGVPAFLAAVNGLTGGSQVTTPQTPGTIPLA